MSGYKTDEYREWHAKQAREWRAKNKERDYARQIRWKKNNREKYKAIQENSSLKKHYGITTEQRDALLSAQGGQCAICASPHPNRKSHTWAVDHCHSTKRVRGVLCHHCNAVLGYARDNIEILESAIVYLKRSKVVA